MKFNESLKDIKNYETGKPIELVVREFGIDKSEIIKLASNENPYGCSKKVLEEVSNIVNQVFRYPDDSYFVLKNKLAKKFDLESENFIIGSGSDQIFEFISRAVLNKNEKVLVNKITFAMYEIYAKQEAATMVKTDTIVHTIDKFIDLYKEHNPKLVYVCTPSNPVGDALDLSDIYKFLDICDSDTLVVVDGAYMEYASFKDPNKNVSPKDLITKYPNVIYTGTFSKAYGLGGMRVGYGIGAKDVIATLHKLRPPFNITTLTLCAAIAALDDENFVNESIKNNFIEMDKYKEFLEKNGFEYIDSYTNFITILLGELDSTKISNSLLRKGVIVRNLAGYGMNAIRVTIGTQKENEIFFKKFNEVTGS